MSSLQPDLVRFFENLPFVPLTHIIKHFEDPDLIKLSVLSVYFQNAIPRQKEMQFVTLSLDIEKSEITVDNFPYTFGEPKKKVVIRYINADSDKESIDNDKNLWIHRKNWKTQGNRLIMNISQSICDKFSVIFRRIHTLDSMWMTREDLWKVNCRWMHFGANQFTDKDFNAFLHSWIAGSHDKVQHYTFQVGEDVRIEEVIKGLITEKWDPKKRDQKFITYSPTGVVPPLIDMADGYDITLTCQRERLGTVLITDNTLHIVAWCFPKRMNYMDCLQECEVVFYNILIEGAVTPESREKYQRKRAVHLESLRNIREDPTLEVDGFQYPEDPDSDQDD